MNVEDYKESDIEEVLKLKQKALGHIQEIVEAIWTDDIMIATGSTLKLYESLQRVRVKKDIKRNQNNMRMLAEELRKQGIIITPIKKPISATDANRLNN